MSESSAVFPLTPVESKRLIAKGVAALPVVQAALATGRVFIAAGTTNGYVAEELLGVEVVKYRYATGLVTQGTLCVTPPGDRVPPYAVRQGEILEGVSLEELLAEFTADDVFIKGGNALDSSGTVGVLVSGATGGTIGAALGIVQGRGAHLIMPVGLEKMVSSVAAAARAAGSSRFRYAYGSAAGLIPVVGAEVVTELTALRLLTGVDAVHLASGGVGGSEGAVVIAVTGAEEAVANAFRLVQRLKKETPCTAVRRTCGRDCTYHCTRHARL
ncbi:MAG: hypothetical protein QME79_06165 [Bacillota bacterium]|nr:hypothetical protein [Bacillota bacterium]